LFLFSSECERHNNNLEQNDNDVNEFSWGFINDDDPNENFIDGNVDHYSNSPSFEIIEETKVSHRMLVSTQQVAMTLFHQVVPSQTLQIQLNPMMPHNKHSIENVDAKRMEDLYVMGKWNLFHPSKKIASLVVFVFTLLFMHRVYLEEEMEICKPKPKKVKEKRMRESQERVKWNESKEVWFVGVKCEKRLSVVLKEIGIFLTIFLALCTTWASHG